ncbi:MAG: uroporphyrinogen-III C-methyltransferase [Burkholderiales bacterium]|nr:uroporphyrinogen-III C-methyltransferase [Burkholderiales bacterium]
MSGTDAQAAQDTRVGGPGAPTATPARHGLPAWLNPALILAALALAGVILLAWNTLARLQDMELQLARRIGELDAAGREARAAARDANALLNDLSARLTALETRAQEAQSQQLALAAMYHELARSQDERVLADIEQTLLLAQQQLKLAGNVRAALIALESAEARLARLAKPQFAALQEAIGRDIARLKLLPAADVAGIHARLDVLVQNVDKLRLVTDPAPMAARPSPSAPGGERWQRWWQEALAEFRQLVRVQRMDRPEAPLLAPEQAWFLRENLKLRLLAARLAMLNRDQTAYRADLSAAHDWVGRYFDPKDPLTQSMLASLGELAALPVAQQEADLDESLKTLRGLNLRTQGPAS